MENVHPFSAYLYREYPDLKTLYVAPRPQNKRPETDYLTLLYRNLQSSSSSRELKIEFLSASQFIRLVSLSRIDPAQVLLHLHWMEFQRIKSAIGFLFKWLCVIIYLRRGGRIIWSVHNLFPHQGKWIKSNLFISRWLANKATAILLHCKSIAPQVSDSFQVDEHKFVVIPHVSYPLERISQVEAHTLLHSQFKLDLSEDKPTFLLFGQISSYKQIPETVLSILTEVSNCRLIVAGRVMSDGKKDALLLKKYHEEHPELILLFQSIDDEAIRALFSISDATILNYKAILDSGVFHLARSLKTPIIARSIGCFSEWSESPDVFLFQNEKEMIRHAKSITDLKTYR